MRYIALLRGVNVGGRIVKMDQLRQVMTAAGLENVRTYIQSGNVFFDADQDNEMALTLKIEQLLEANFGFVVPVYLRTVEEFEQALKGSPFRNIQPTENERFCVIFTYEQVPNNLILPLMAPKQDLEIVGVTSREAFVIWKIINDRPPTSLSNTWLEKTLGSSGTSRFYHTSEKILAAAKK